MSRTKPRIYGFTNFLFFWKKMNNEKTMTKATKGPFLAYSNKNSSSVIFITTNETIFNPDNLDRTKYSENKMLTPIYIDI